MTLLLAIIRTENEDNAVLCMKIIIDLHRTYSKQPTSPPNPDGTPAPEQPPSPVEASVDELLEIVADLFKGMGAVVEETFSGAAGTTPSADPAPSPASSTALLPTDEGPPGLQGPATPVILQPAMKSFKLLQDCPAAIVFIFQTYRTLVNKAISVFVPLVFEVRSSCWGRVDASRS